MWVRVGDRLLNLGEICQIILGETVTGRWVIQAQLGTGELVAIGEYDDEAIARSLFNKLEAFVNATNLSCQQRDF